MVSKVYVALDLQSKLQLGTKSPLHITITPPVRVEEAAFQHIKNNLTQSVRNLGPLVVRGATEDYFGPYSDAVRVRKVERTPALVQVHTLAMMTLKKVVPEIDTTYTGDRWEPHATYNGEFGLEEGEVHIINELTILRKTAEVWDRAAIVSLVGE